MAKEKIKKEVKINKCLNCDGEGSVDGKVNCSECNGKGIK